VEQQVESPTHDDILAAAERIAAVVHRTPLATCAAIDHIAGASLVFKCEQLQKVGAFKARGATNAVLSLDVGVAARGVCTHSSGNHAAALARAAALRGIPAWVVMPRTAPPVKRAAVAGYGAEIVDCEPTLAARESTLAEVVARTGATFIHPYDDPRVIAGQGTAVLELLQEQPDLDAVIVPVGGGGLASGTALAVAGSRPDVAVWGAEPAGAADAARSLARGVLQPSVDPDTICDGLLTALSPRTFAILRRHLAGVLTVPDATVRRALRLLLERAKLLVEPSAAITLAAVLEHPGDFRGRRLGLILSGGNLDLERLPDLLRGRD
jgi:threonine dehydratase